MSKLVCAKPHIWFFISMLLEWCNPKYLQITFPDFHLYEVLDVHKMFHPTCLDGFPKLQAFVQRFEVRYFYLFLQGITMTSHEHHGISNHRPLNYSFHSLSMPTTNIALELHTAGLVWGESISEICIPLRTADNTEDVSISWRQHGLSNHFDQPLNAPRGSRYGAKIPKPKAETVFPPQRTKWCIHWAKRHGFVVLL